MLLDASFAPRPAFADECNTVRYSYDSSGRLVGVTDQLGQTARYGYDEVGNGTSVQNLSTPALSVMSVTPRSGAPGTAVTISGGCFSLSPAANLVQFNGTAATVTSASPARLVVIVPEGATTGPVTVTVGSASATSDVPFTIDPAANGPSITGVTPAVVNVGDTISVSGTNFDSDVSAQVAALNGTRAPVQNATTTGLDILAPSGTSSGRVSVRTARGTATGPDVYVAPSPYTAADVVTTARTSIGVPQTVSIPMANKIGLVLFDLSQGQRASITLSGGTFGSCGLSSVKVLDIRGTTVRSLGCPSNSDFIDTFTASATGTYELLFVAAATATGTITAKVSEVPADATVTASIGGAAVTVTSTVPGQNLAVAFTGTAGQRVFFKFTDNTFGCCLSTVVRKPDGSMLVSTSIGSADSIDTTTLPVDGAYTIYFNPSGGPAVTLSTTTPGQNLAVTFPGTAGQRVFFKFTGNTFGCCLSTVVRKPDGSTLVSTSIGSADSIDTTTLPVDGAYTIYFNPSGAAVGSVTTQLFEVPADAVATTSIGGPAVTLSTTTPGQNLAVTFPGTAGQRVFFKFTNNTFGCCLSTVVRKPDGSMLVSTSIGSADSIDTTTLPVDGAYTIYFNPSGAPVGSVTTQLFEVPADAVATTSIGGPAVTLSTTTPGQNLAVTFPGTAGQRVFFKFTGNTFGCCLSTVVRKPDGSTLVSTSIGSSDSIDTTTLPVDGAYTIYFNPSGAAVGSVTTQLFEVPADAVATASIGGPAVMVTSTVPGQNLAVAFVGTAGQRVFFKFTNNTFGCCLSTVVRKPDGSMLVSTSIGSADSIDTTTLPVDGAYTIYFNPSGAPVGSVTTQLFEVPADAVATTSIGGPAVTLSTTTPGQNLAVTFPGTAGQRVFFKFTNNTFGCCLSTVVRKPDGSMLVSTSIGSADSIDTTTLPVDGAYTIYFNPSGAPVGSVTTQLFEVPADAVATTSIGGPAVTLSTTTPGQNLAVTFPGTAGQRVFFKFTGNTFGCCLSTVVRKPDGSTLVSTSIGSSDSIDTTTLPVDGAYTIYFNPSGAAVGSVTTQLFEVPADAVATASIGGPAVMVTSTVPGQNLAVAFVGTAGQRVFFKFTNNTFGCCLSTVVRKPDGSMLVSTSIGSADSIDTTTLPVDGAYTIYFNPSGAPVGSVTTQLFEVPADAVATTSIGGPAVTLSTTTPGQNLAVTFPGTAGQRVFFKFTNNTFGCCLSTVVRKPDGSMLVSTSIGSADSIDTTTLPVDGAYTIYFNPSGAPVGSVTTQLFEVPADAVATTSIGGPAVTLSTTTPGQNLAVTFPGTAGQRVFFKFTGNTFGCCLSTVVRKPDGSTLVSTSIGSSDSIDTTTLPVDGAYTIYFNPSGAAVGSVTTQLFEVPADAVATASIGGPAVMVTSTVPGQNLAVAFVGTAGQRVLFKFTNNTFGCCLSTVVRKPDGSMLVSTSIGSADSIDTTTLPVDGAYTIYFNPSGAPVGSVTTQLFEVPADAVATTSIGGPAVTLSTTTPGQNLAVTFPGTAGQRVFFKFTGNTFGCCLSTVVRKPDGSTLVSTSIGSSDSIDTTTLPVDGAYTIYFNPSGAAVGSVTTQLFEVPADAVATTSIGGPAVTLSTTTPGQNLAVTFLGTAGQRVFFKFTNNTFGCCLSTVVRKPDGSTLVSTSIGSSDSIDTTTLPVDGAYTIYFNPS